MSKPREFWINPSIIIEHPNAILHPAAPKAFWPDEIHVIEYSAYEKALEVQGNLADLIKDSTNQVVQLVDEKQALRKERDEALARLAQRHIFGKAYEVTRENINRLAGELDSTKKERDELELALECVSGAHQVSDIIKERDEMKTALRALEHLQGSTAILKETLAEESRTWREEALSYRAALEKCANESARETNGKEQYEQDSYGYILKICKEVLAKYPNSLAEASSNKESK